MQQNFETLNFRDPVRDHMLMEFYKKLNKCVVEEYQVWKRGRGIDNLGKKIKIKMMVGKNIEL